MWAWSLWASDVEPVHPASIWEERGKREREENEKEREEDGREREEALGFLSGEVVAAAFGSSSSTNTATSDLLRSLDSAVSREEEAREGRLVTTFFFAPPLTSPLPQLLWF